MDRVPLSLKSRVGLLGIVGLLVTVVSAACAQDTAEDCTPGGYECECAAGLCLDGLECIAGVCLQGDDDTEGDGDGDGDGVGDGDGDGDGAGDGDGDGDGDGFGDGDGDGDGFGDGDGDGDGGGDGDGDGDGAGDGDGDGDGDGVGEDCDPIAQDCDPGLKCVPYANNNNTWNDNKCVPIQGNKGSGEICTADGIEEGTDDCDGDHLCWGGYGVDGGVCVPFCTGTWNDPECPGDMICSISNQDSITICLDTCDPLTQNCPDGDGCYWDNSDFTCIYTTENWQEGQTCGYVNDCAPGLMCMQSANLPDCPAAYCCTPWCDVSGADDCIDGKSCVAWFAEGEAPAGYEDVGVCMLP